MKYRALSPTGDYIFGRGAGEFLSNSPEAVAQAVVTRLRLAAGEWFLDVTEGTPYGAQILGMNKQMLHDQAIKERIIGTDGVVSLDAYGSSVDQNRRLSVSATITTQYGQSAVTYAFGA